MLGINFFINKRTIHLQLCFHLRYLNTFSSFQNIILKLILEICHQWKMCSLFFLLLQVNISSAKLHCQFSCSSEKCVQFSLTLILLLKTKQWINFAFAWNYSKCLKTSVLSLLNLFSPYFMLSITTFDKHTNGIWFLGTWTAGYFSVEH